MLSYPFLSSLLAHFESEHNVFLVINHCSGGDLSMLKQKQVHNKFLASTARGQRQESPLDCHKQATINTQQSPTDTHFLSP
ncbi:hypothetical protein O6H91_21G001900 [Diphasiastrum complanatum]|uniref:Uncharacterized protein n=1 Tax=Diphasiastrum complanatum TaxID=34168 RepID=A0ACC2AHB3_DIPCM|nr:hypothetical protein O6H91_21G001900 [Diphasiastrum complanatum]